MAKKVRHNTAKKVHKNDTPLKDSLTDDSEVVTIRYRFLVLEDISFMPEEFRVLFYGRVFLKKGLYYFHFKFTQLWYERLIQRFIKDSFYKKRIIAKVEQGLMEDIDG